MLKVLWCVPKFLVTPTWGSKYVELQKVGTWGPFPTSSIKGGERGGARSLEIRLGRGPIMFLHNPASKTHHKRVSSHSGTSLGVGTNHGHLDSLDSPRPRLRGSHHLPPYNIFCNSPPRLHSNGTFSRDSQSGVSKLSRGTLGIHNFLLKPPIGMRSEAIL
jgi:hypothetical protein